MKTIFLMLLITLSVSCEAQQEGSMKEFEENVNRVISEIVKLKSTYPEQLNTIEDARIEKEITDDKFWLGFHFIKGKHIKYLSGIKETEGVDAFEEHGIELHIYFFQGDWTGARVAKILPFGDLNVVVFIENGKGLYLDIVDIINSENELNERNHK